MDATENESNEMSRENHLKEAMMVKERITKGNGDEYDYDLVEYHLRMAGEWRKLLEESITQLETRKGEIERDELYSDGRARHLTQEILKEFIRHGEDAEAEVWYKELIRYFTIHRSDYGYYRQNWDFSRKGLSDEEYKKRILHIEKVFKAKGMVPLQRRDVLAERLYSLARFTLKFDGLKIARPLFKLVAEISEPHVKFVRSDHSIWYPKGKLLSSYYHLGWFEVMKDHAKWVLSGSAPDPLNLGVKIEIVQTLGFLSNIRGDQKDAFGQYREADRLINRQFNHYWGDDDVYPSQILISKWIGDQEVCRERAVRILETNLSRPPNKGLLPRLDQLEMLRRIAILANEPDQAEIFSREVMENEAPSDPFLRGMLHLHRAYVERSQRCSGSALQELRAAEECFLPVIRRGVGVWRGYDSGTDRERSAYGRVNLLRGMMELESEDTLKDADPTTLLLTAPFPWSLMSSTFQMIDDTHEYFSLLLKRFPEAIKDHEKNVTRPIWTDPEAMMSE